MNACRLWITCLALAGAFLQGGCSVRKMAVTRVADALAGSGQTFAADDDPDLVRDALPFSLKLMESILLETPNHVGLLTAAGSAFTEYSYAFIQQQADLLEDDDIDQATALRARARGLYLRGRNYALRGLEVRHPGFTNVLAADPGAAAAQMGKEDVPLLYWAAAAWLAAVSQAKDDPSLVGDLPRVEALLYRVLDLDESWNKGAVHTVLITYEMSRATGQGDPVARATRHFERALALGNGHVAAPFVSYAEAVCVPREDRAQFQRLLLQAMEIDVNAEPSARVENLVMQRRARWLLGRIDKLFLPPLE